MADDVFLKTADVAKLFQVSESTVRYWRQNGTGPRFARIGNKVRYHPRDVDRWFQAQLRATAKGST